MYLVEQPKFTEKKMAEAEAKAAEALELMKSQVDWLATVSYQRERGDKGLLYILYTCPQSFSH